MLYSRKEFYYKLDYEGWDYMLQEVNPEEVEDPVLAEALQDAQEAFNALLKVAPTYEEIELEDETEEYYDDEEDKELIEELDFNVE